MGSPRARSLLCWRDVSALARIAFVLLLTSPAAAQPRLDAHRVPAGTTLETRLRTVVGSAFSQVDDQVDATLLSAIATDGIELIPAGSVLHGRVVEVRRASATELRGRVTVAFFVVQHRQTNSRATIATEPVVFDAPAADPGEKADRKARKAAKRPIDVETPAALPLSVVLASPLTVFVPK